MKPRTPNLANPIDLAKLREVWAPISEPKCMHRSCSRCHGTGRQANGTPCVHAMSCPCRQCRNHAVLG